MNANRQPKEMYDENDFENMQNRFGIVGTLKPITYDAPMGIMAVPAMNDCPANEARYMGSLTVPEPELAPVYETGDLGAGFYIGVLPDGGRVLAA